MGKSGWYYFHAPITTDCPNKGKSLHELNEANEYYNRHPDKRPKLTKAPNGWTLQAHKA